MTKRKKQFIDEVKYDALGIAIIAIAVYMFWILTISPSGPFELREEGPGILGKMLTRMLVGLAGEGKYLIPFLLLITGIAIIFKKVKINKIQVLINIALIFSILTHLHLQLPLAEQTIESGYNGLGGGLIGAIISYVTVTIFGVVGSYIVLISIWIASLLYITKSTFGELTKRIFSLFIGFLKKIKDQIEDFIFVTVEEKGGYENIPKPSKNHLQVKEQPLIINHYEEPETDEDKTLKKAIKKEEETEIFIDNIENNFEGEFVLPPINILNRVKRNKNTLTQRDINDNIYLLQNTLESFGVSAKVVQVSCGPSITRYELQPAPGVKVSRIVNLADDIALSLASADVRIEAPIPGKAAIGIEVPNSEIATVSLREVLESKEFQESKSNLSVVLGKDIAGKSVVTDLAQMPHLLIAGATGSGKSVCMNTLITSILFKSKPTEVKFLMIDPKMVELSTFNGIPHLISPVITDAKKAASALRWAVHEMENRYELFAASGVKDINRYNQGPNQLPYIVVLIDELADLMMVAPADVEDAICRLAQMARACGIHLVVATQRPSVDVITGIIKANIPSRIAFAVSSQTDSRTILDMNGAEKLLGKGDMLFYPTGFPKPVRLQGAFVSDKEVEEVVEFLKAQAKPKYQEGILDQEVITVDSSKEETEDDPLIPEVAKIFIENGQASISLIQRRFRIGYNRAARIIDIMEKKGIVGGYEGSKPRQVLISVEDYQRLFGNY
ncbi:MAG: DNA translocase FtsK [Clostridia bacterium]|nr:DNA translocase FtsK [Clostridia bacterium]